MEEKNVLNKIKENPFGIADIKNPSEEMKLIAVKSNGLAYKYLSRNESHEVKKTAILSNPLCVEYMEDLEDDLAILAVKNLWNSLKLIKNPSKKVIEEAVNTKGWALQYVENPWEELCISAVKKDYDAIKYINEPSEAIQLAAVNSYFGAIKFIKNPTIEVKRQSIRLNAESINYISSYDLDEVKLFIKDNFKVVKYLYDSIDVDLVVEVLMEKMAEENIDEQYVRDYISLEILEMDKVNFIREYGSKNAKKSLVKVMLETN